MDPLQRFLHLATEAGLLSPVARNRVRLRTSLYADDAVIFVKPVKEEISCLARLLDLFGKVAGVCTNVQKSSITPINCGHLDLDNILADLPAQRVHFPIKYLGLPLSVRRLRKVDFAPLVDKAQAKLTSWWGRNITQAGRLTLTKAVLTSQPVYLLSVLNAPKEILEDLDKLRKRFLWAGDQALTGGKCKLNWPTINRPKVLGGVGVLDLQQFARPLRIHWLWQQHSDPAKPWIGLGNPCTETDRLLYAACTKIEPGDGERISLWHDAWVTGHRPKKMSRQ